MKRLTPGTVTIGVFAILFGLAAAYAARRYFDVAPEVAKPAPRAKTVAVVFSKINLPPYSRIRDEDVTVRQVPVDQAPAGALTSKSRALFRLVKSTVMADQPVADTDLFAVGEVPKLSDRLTPGHRAVTLPIGGDGAVNGMIQPESHVDINLTVKDNHPEMGGMATMTVMRNVRVLATGDARFPRSEDRPLPVNNVTVSVSPEDANKLILAQRYGTLSMTLCSTQEEGQADPNMTADGRHLVNKDSLLGLAPLPIAAEPTVVAKTVEVWRGGQRVEVTFNENEILEALNATEVAEGREPMQALPVSVRQEATQPAAKKGECKDCEKKKAAKAAANSPTLAPSRTDSAAAPITSPHVASQVLEVQVEAQQLGSGG